MSSNLTVGGIAAFDHYIFVGDTGNASDPRGIVRFDNNGGPTVRFADFSPQDITLGADGILYALGGSSIQMFDPNTLLSVGSLALGPSGDGTYRAVVGAVDGSFFIATSGGLLQHRAADNSILASINSDFNFMDMDLAPDGRIALGTTFDGEIVMTNTALSPFTSFVALSPDSIDPVGGHVFVAFVPEPSTIVLLAILVCMFGGGLDGTYSAPVPKTHRRRNCRLVIDRFSFHLRENSLTHRSEFCG